MQITRVFKEAGVLCPPPGATPVYFGETLSRWGYPPLPLSPVHMQASHVLPRASPRPWKAGAAASQACLPTLTEPTAAGQSESGASHHDRDLSGHLLLR